LSVGLARLLTVLRVALRRVSRRLLAVLVTLRRRVVCGLLVLRVLLRRLRLLIGGLLPGRGIAGGLLGCGRLPGGLFTRCRGTAGLRRLT
jgi:hypothetical protein